MRSLDFDRMPQVDLQCKQIRQIFAIEYFLDEEDIKEDDDDDIVPYFVSTCVRRDRVPSVRTFHEEVLPDFSSFGLIFSHLKELFSECHVVMLSPLAPFKIFRLNWSTRLVACAISVLNKARCRSDAEL